MSRLVITVVGPEEVYLNKERHTLATLGETLGALTEADREEVKSVVLEADRAISYSLMVEVLDVLRRNKFRGVNLKTTEGGSRP
jgi:biopolymer transport protein ExbD